MSSLLNIKKYWIKTGEGCVSKPKISKLVHTYLNHLKLIGTHIVETCLQNRLSKLQACLRALAGCILCRVWSNVEETATLEMHPLAMQSCTGP